MNRTIATCTAGMRRKASTRIRIHFFQGRLDPAFFAFGIFVFRAGIFAKRPLGRTELNSQRAWIFASAQNERRCWAVSDIPITEKLLLNAGGWQAMKPARELLKSGRVSEAKYEPPLLSGYVREGMKNYRSGLRIKSFIDVENICSCWESRSAGKICAHSVAVGLAYLKPSTAAVSPPNEGVKVAPPAIPQFVEADSANATLTTLHFILPPNFASAWQKGQVMIVVEAQVSRNRTLVSALPKKDTFAVDRSDLALIKGLRAVSAIFESGMAIMNRATALLRSS